MSASDAAISRLFEMLPTLTDLTIQHIRTATSRVDHDQHVLGLPAGLPPEQQAHTLLHALIDLDHGPGRESHAQKDYEETLRETEE
jgi:hypothetical protein